MLTQIIRPFGDRHAGTLAILPAIESCDLNRTNDGMHKSVAFLVDLPFVTAPHTSVTMQALSLLYAADDSMHLVVD